ncbi:MAG: AraC family transcriptional regulator [Acholeplasmatales bacterium]|nr:MAG: AraC family transcriptional regulator [Acholeplasmatales bacterium]
MSQMDNLLLANYTELSLHECGREKCQPGKVITLDVKTYHLFHYVLYGSGTFIFNNKTYQLKKGDMFYIPPGETALYYPSDNNPWIYTWIGFSGTKSDQYLKRIGISDDHPIYHDTKELNLKPLFNDLADRYNHSQFLSIECLAIFMNILYKMMIAKHKEDVVLSAKETHIRMAKQFVENNFQFKIKVTDIANSLSLSPNYLANIFKETLGMSPKQYLTDYRMHKACQLLSNGVLSIKDVAKRVGYANPLHFSAEFKRVKRMSPTTYKNQNEL